MKKTEDDLYTEMVELQRAIIGEGKLICIQKISKYVFNLHLSLMI